MNKKYIFIILFIPLSIIPLSCGNKEYDGRDLTLKEGLLFRAGEKIPFTGKVKDHLNGKIMEYEVKAGMKDGKFVLRLGNGTIEMEGNIKENKNEGMWNYYYPNGAPESKGNFKDDLVDGKWYWYYPDGKIKEEAEFKKGLAEGYRIIYNTDGSINKKINFKNNNAVDTLYEK